MGHPSCIPTFPLGPVELVLLPGKCHLGRARYLENNPKAYWQRRRLSDQKEEPAGRVRPVFLLVKQSDSFELPT